MWSNEALDKLVSLRNKLQVQPDLFDPYWTNSDNLGILASVVCDISSFDLRRILYYSNTDYVQCNWIKIFDDYNSSRKYSYINYDLEQILQQLLSIFTLEQLQEINNATSSYEECKEYECYMSFLNGVIVNNTNCAIFNIAA